MLHMQVMELYTSEESIKQMATNTDFSIQSKMLYIY